MKSHVIFTLLAASSALAAPTTANMKRGNFIIITDFHANAGTTSPGAFMHFVVTDPNYPNDTPTECNLIWTYGRSPKQNARCNNSEYYIRFPQGPPDFNLFTLELERVNGTIPESGQVLLNSNADGGAPGTKWICENNPKPHIEISCSYQGPLQLFV